MSRHGETLDPRMEADLAALDAALAGAPDADPAWTALVADVRREEPVMRPSFRADLARDVAAGFGRGGAPAEAGAGTAVPRGRFGGRLRRALLPALAVAGCAAAGAIVVTSGDPDGGALRAPAGGGSEAATSGGAAGDSEAAGGGSGSAGGDAAGSSAAQSAPPESGSGAAGGSASSVAPIDPGTSTVGPLGGRRRVEASTSMTLTTTPGELQDVVDGIVRETGSAGGVVASSQVISTGGGGSAQLVLRVPNARAAAAVARISELGGVASLAESTQDVTGAYVSARDRLADARARRTALLRALARADGAREADALERRLRRERSRIARLEGDVRSLTRRTSSSRIDVAVEAREAGGGGLGAWTPRDAARDALRVLEVGAGVALVVAAVLAPFAALALLGVGVRRARRRRREAVLRPA